MILPLRLLPFLFCACAAAAPDCQALFDEHLKTDLDLSYQAFDQTEDGGFRLLAQAGCNREAADLIEVYVARHGATERSLRWHIAQLRATGGEYKRALVAARSVLDKDEDLETNPLRWNDYVLATIAFLEHDKAALIRHRDEVAEGADEFWGNALNLKLLDSLIRNFDRDYAYATSHEDAAGNEADKEQP